MTLKKNPSDKKQAGRKTAYKPEYVELAHNYSLLGATDVEMSDLFGVSKQTLNTWKKQYPEFLDSLKKGKHIADSYVAAKLYKRAIGYNYDELHVEKKGRKVVSRKTVNKHMPPDTTAQIFWLKNRQPEKWRDRTITELTGKDGKDLITGSIDVDEWIKTKSKK